MQSNRKLYIVHTRQRTLVDRATKHLECACNQHIRLALTIIHICMYEYGYSISAACPLSQTRPICLHTFSGQQRCHAIICTCHAIVPNWSWCRTMYRSGALGESLPYYRTSIAQFKIADQICLVCLRRDRAFASFDWSALCVRNELHHVYRTSRQSSWKVSAMRAMHINQAFGFLRCHNLWLARSINNIFMPDNAYWISEAYPFLQGRHICISNFLLMSHLWRPVNMPYWTYNLVQAVFDFAMVAGCYRGCRTCVHRYSNSL